ncbi:Facilitated trehalose transporter Tret1 [Habropoda laboriosa]|uniref:Facilitated trehalose transporter Tret1 n=1 Tax=Habropoda laboriosa TaxID=597456 RepID=A0A0L7RBX0_9HYME|nr:PREDICTED: facilitated trehalose transporter Tret1-like [Habropoda laboriosa]KOC68300.1 Facilitated trehalose transporter Tret1 [Habropoda laboriosa]
MPPTHDHEGKEGRYKEYAYSPVPESASSAVYDSTTLGKYTEFGTGSPSYRFKNGVLEKCRDSDMTEKGSTLLQYVAAAAANLCCVSAGAMLAWTSPIKAKLQDSLDDNPLGVKITDDENSWIGSLVAVGAMIGSFIAGYMAERWGRKKTLLAAVIPFTLGWILVASAKVVFQLYVARIILGIGLAFAFTVVPMYCGEIAEISVRGALGSFLQLFVTFGLLYSYSIGPYVSYLVFWICCAAVPFVFFAVFMTMPESPYFLLKIGKREEAVQALARLRSKSPASVQKEADEMQAAVEEAFREETNFSDLFTVKANLKALIYTCLLASFQQLSGINVVLFYMGNIFESAKSSLPSPIATIIVALVQTCASAVTPVVVDRLGRKVLLIFSGIGEILTMGSLGLYMYLQDTAHADVSGISFLPVLSLVVFISTYSVGWGPLPWTVMGEMFTSNVKSKASGITVCICWLMSFMTTKFSTNLASVATCAPYWLFGIFCLLSVLFTIFVLPETKGKSVQEIQDELNGVKSSLPVFEGSGKH